MGKIISISLGDDNLKRVAEVLGSKSCVRILELLAVDELAVSDIAKRLSMKINTVDYNVKKLVEAGLIEGSGHWWSVRGKRVLTYRVCNKDIVISPRRSVSKKFLWGLGLIGVAGVFLRRAVVPVQKIGYNSEEVFLEAVSNADVFARDAMAQGAVSSVGVSFWGSLAGWEWFLVGVWVSVVLFFVWNLIAEKK